MEVRKKGTSAHFKLVVTVTYFVGIAISAKSFGWHKTSVFLFFLFSFIVPIYLHIAMFCHILLVKNDIDNMKAWHTSLGYARNFETFILCAA